MSEPSRLDAVEKQQSKWSWEKKADHLRWQAKFVGGTSITQPSKIILYADHGLMTDRLPWWRWWLEVQLGLPPGPRPPIRPENVKEHIWEGWLP